MRIFISYGRKDTHEFAQRLSQWLRELGHDTWLDVEHGIPLGTPFDIKIEVGIQESTLVLALLSPWSVRPEGFCRNELLYAQAHNINILPVMIADVVPPIQIFSLNRLDASADPESVFSILPATLDKISQNTYTWQSTYAAGSWWEKLRLLTFQEELKRYGADFTGREWLFDQLQAWAADKNSRYLLLTGEMGIGKSALSVQMTARMDVKGIHFCSRSNPDSCRPESLISALIYQLAHQFSPYREIIDQIPPPDPSLSSEALFRQFVTDPLLACEDKLNIENPWIVIVDALDEATAAAGSSMTDFMVDSVDRFPHWFRMIATARPDLELSARFRRTGIRQMSLEASSENNLSDIADYIRIRTQEKELSAIPDIKTRIEERAAGNFLYAKTLLDALTDTNPDYRLSPGELDTLPPALGGLFNAMFRKRFPDLALYEKEVAPLAACLVATRLPVPEPLLIAASGLNLRTANRGLRALSQFLTRSGDESRFFYRFFHQSLIQWMTEDTVANPFAAYLDEGYARLADACLKEVERGTAEISEYTLFTLPYYLVEAKMLDDLKTLLTDPAYFKAITWLLLRLTKMKFWAKLSPQYQLCPLVFKYIFDFLIGLHLNPPKQRFFHWQTRYFSILIPLKTQLSL